MTRESRIEGGSRGRRRRGRPRRRLRLRAGPAVPESDALHADQSPFAERGTTRRAGRDPLRARRPRVHRGYIRRVHDRCVRRRLETGGPRRSPSPQRRPGYTTSRGGATSDVNRSCREQAGKAGWRADAEDRERPLSADDPGEADGPSIAQRDQPQDVGHGQHGGAGPEAALRLEIRTHGQVILDAGQSRRTSTPGGRMSRSTPGVKRKESSGACRNKVTVLSHPSRNSCTTGSAQSGSRNRSSATAKPWAASGPPLPSASPPRRGPVPRRPRHARR